MGFFSNSQLKQFSCGDVILGSSGMLTLAFGPACDALSGAPASNAATYDFFINVKYIVSGSNIVKISHLVPIS